MILVRPAPPRAAARPLAPHARWLARFAPPFEFGDFFAPEDTVLCAEATAWALRRHELEHGSAPRRVVELTCGSALVALAQLDRRPALRAWGADVDAPAVARARRNARALRLATRARFAELGLFDRALPRWLRRIGADVVACNPPYIPEPPDAPLALVAGAGADGAAHPRRTIAVAARAGVQRLVLSWCSLGDPVRVARDAARRGYALEALWVAAIADGEYSGEVHGYVRTLPTAFLSEAPATLDALAPDGAARFAYLLLAGSFVRADAAAAAPAPAEGPRLVRRVVSRFARRGLDGLRTRPTVSAPPRAARGPALRVYAVDRWDELELRAAVHGAGAATARG